MSRATDGAPAAWQEPVDREGRARALKILARSLCKDLEARGFDQRDVLGLASELIEEVTAHVGRSQHALAPALDTQRRRRA